MWFRLFQRQRRRQGKEPPAGTPKAIAERKKGRSLSY
jgi:hypothetical protein